MGQCLLAMGFLFLAIKMISEGGKLLAASPELTEALRLLADIRGSSWQVWVC